MLSLSHIMAHALRMGHVCACIHVCVHVLAWSERDCGCVCVHQLIYLVVLCQCVSLSVVYSDTLEKKNPEIF